MRLHRTSLLARLTADDVPPVVLLEAPAGYGKSWLARRAATGDIVRLRGELGRLAEGPIRAAGTVLLDDAHLLSADDVDVLRDRIEDAEGGGRLIVAGRLLADAIHEVTQLVDGLIIDSTALAVTASEIVEVLPPGSPIAADHVAEAADGSVRVIATAIDEALRDRSSDAAAIASRLVRSASETAVHQLDARGRAVVALLVRAPGLDVATLEGLAGDGFVRAAVACGVPLRRKLDGTLELAAAAALRGTPVDPAVAATLADDLLQRGGRAREAITLVLDAGSHERASSMLRGLTESVADAIEPLSMLSLLARLGTAVDHDPELLLRRAGASRLLGRLDDAAADIDRAVERAITAAPRVRRRVAVESARARLTQGDVAMAERIVRDTLVELGVNEDQTYARAYQVLGECAMDSDNREDLQRAAANLRIAARTWESCSEFARGRACRIALVLGVLVPLGRYDEALAQTAQLLTAPDLTDAERAHTLLAEGFVLCNANRLDAAEQHFERTADYGYLQDNPRLIAMAAWGMAITAARRSDLPSTLRWLSTAENTASFTTNDDMLGVPYLRDAAQVLGALGDLDGAARYLDLARERSPVFTGQLLSETFMFDARRGQLGDLAAALERTPPAEWWRTKLVAAHAMAAQGDLAGATLTLVDAERELASLGFRDFVALGEGRIHQALLALLRGSKPPAAAGGLRVEVMGGPVVVLDGATERPVPAGNPQRLVGVIVARGGAVTLDQASEALWGDDDLERSRTRLRNVLMRLRRAVGDLVVRTGNGLRLAASVTCDLDDFRRRAQDALATARADPELAGDLARAAVGDRDDPVFVDFEYDDWAIASRRQVDLQRVGLLDLLSVQAEDAGDLAAAQGFAERALRLDRYTDSRYVRLAELLTMQDRATAAIAVLEDAATMAREASGRGLSTATRRDELLRRAKTGT